MITTQLATALGLALLVLTAAVLSLLADGRRITRLERTVAVAHSAIDQVTAERDEARRSLLAALEARRETYVRLRPQDVERNQYLPDWAITPYPQDRSRDGVPEVAQQDMTLDFRRFADGGRS